MSTLAFPIGAIVRGPRALAERGGGWRSVDFPVRYGVFTHPTAGIVLVDTGYTPDLWHARGIDLALYRALLRPRLIMDQQPEAVLAGMGATPGDVRHVIVTHLHADHVCGLARFPRAAFHLSRRSLAFFREAGAIASLRQSLHRNLLPAHFHERCVVLDDARTVRLPGDLGFGHDVFGDGACLAIDLAGHMEGHVGIAWPEREQPVLYAVDAAWTRRGLDHAPLPPLPLRLVLADRTGALASAAMTRRLAAAGWRIVLCHDPVEP